MEAAEVALQPAWAALQAGEHKVPPTPPRPLQAARRLAPSPCGAAPSCSARARPPPGGGLGEGSAGRRQAGACDCADCAMVEATGAARSDGCAHDGSLAVMASTPDCSFGGIARALPSSSALSPFSPSPPTGLEARACSAECPDGPASGQCGRPGSLRRCSSALEASTHRDADGGSHTPPRTRGPQASAQQGSLACAEPCATMQREAAQAAAMDAGGGGFRTPPRSHNRLSWGQQGSPSRAEPSAAMQGWSAQASAGPGLAGAAAASCAIPQDEWPAAPFLRRFSAPWVHVSMATAGVALREKQRRYAEAADLLRLLLGAGCWRHLGSRVFGEEIRVLSNASESMMGGGFSVACKSICTRRFKAAWFRALLAARNEGHLRVFGPGGECCYNRRGEWWVRLSIDTEHMGRPEEALEVTRMTLLIQKLGSQLVMKFYSVEHLLLATVKKHERYVLHLCQEPETHGAV